MTSAVIKRTDTSSNFIYIEDSMFLVDNPKGSGTYSVSEVGSDKYISLESDRVKLIVFLSKSLYHFWYDGVGSMLSQLSQLDSNPVLVLDHRKTGSGGIPKFYDFFLKILKDKNIDYIEIDSHSNNYKINKFYYLDRFINLHDNWSNLIYDFVGKELYDTTPHKAYITRSHLKKKYFADLPPGLNGYSDFRIADESVLEQFFFNIGFDIIRPESFDSYEDQINYFHNSSIIVGTSGSSLANAIFMKPGSTVIEIQTPLILSHKFDDRGLVAVEDLHFFYSLICYQKGHRYVAIPNHTGQSRDIIDSVNSLGEIIV